MRILLPIDESNLSQEAIRAVIAQFRKKGTEIRVLHVVEPISVYISSEMFPHLVPHVAQIERDRKKQAEQLVQRVAEKLRKADFKATEVVDAGNPKIRILAHAEKWRADLIVVGSHGLKGLSRFAMGSVSEAVARHAQCSVEVVRIRGRRRY